MSSEAAVRRTAAVIAGELRGLIVIRIKKRREVSVMLHIRRIASLLAVLALPVCSGSAAAQDAEARAAIAAVNQQFMAIFKSADPAALTALYSSTGQLLPPHGDIVTGTQAINQFWQGFLAPGIAVTFTSLEIETHDDTGHEVAYYTVTGEGGKVLDTGKYIVIWKREGGQWRLHRDIWNTNTPTPAQ
jgi:uncharacterized protein (TIGR02246 family)